jgi:hypothetical protein
MNHDADPAVSDSEINYDAFDGGSDRAGRAHGD